MHTSFPKTDPLRGAFLPDRALMSRMRSLAIGLRPAGYAAIQSPPGAKEALRALRETISRTREDERIAPLQRAAEALGLFEAVAFARAGRAPKSLPAVAGEARIQTIAREILLHSDGQPSAQRLEDALRAFSETRSLRMEELCLAGDAMRMEALRLFAHVALEVAQMQHEHSAAEQWLCGQGPLLQGCCFLEHAIRLCRENENCACREELEKALSAEEGGAQTVIQRAHEKQARLCIWIENLPAAMRLPASLDPERLLAISDAARLLMDSPCYRECDEDSRAVLRARIGEISHAVHRAESSVVRGALELARQAAPDTLRAQPTWYWTSDTGRRALLSYIGCANIRMKKLVPDPKGCRLLWGVGLLSAGLFIAFRALAQEVPAFLCAMIACWSVAAQAVNALCVRLVPVKPLLRLHLEDVPEPMRTLVVIPAILPDPPRARELVAQLEALAALEDSPNVSFCLLGDFPDAQQQHLPGDAAILAAARAETGAANQRLGGMRLHFLHREREWNEASSRWMGHERKRGALHALNALLLRGENAPWADGEDARTLAVGSFRYVITMDADTRPYPGALRMLLGTIAHPVNALSGLHVLQPRMAQSACGPQSTFVQLMAGIGGVSGYGGGVREVYQDLCAQGGYAGKGIYALQAFDALAGHALPENAILSHDLLEGFLCGSAFAGDIVFLDQFPASLASYFKRMHRWTRGDWQLLPFLHGRTALQKYRMLDNLRACLAAPVSLSLLFLGLGFGSVPTVVLGALVWLSGPLFSLANAEGWLRALVQLSLAPNEALCRLDAIARALHRMLVTRRDMLEWVSAADAERNAGRTPIWPRALCAGLCLALGIVGGLPFAGLLFAFVFLLGAPVLEKLQRPAPRESLSAEQRAFLSSLAADTWRFFAEYTCESGFPPDNVQFDPPRGAANRTSPTNIGLYMASCTAAQKLGLIDFQEMLSRLETTAGSIERAEKWNGMLYNWMDPVSAQPLGPKYVSSVDSGNLAACLLLCAQAVREQSPEHPLTAQLEALARNMDLHALYDDVRRLFYIGYDVQRGAFSSSHYDLLASEARILSYTAIWLKKVPVSHWNRLARACVAAGGGAAPLSWSGTMFEYLMPELFLATPEHTLLGEGCRMCVQEQQKHAVNGFWGVSESGYYAFDSRRNFQYRAFGVRELMLKDERTGCVVSPYSSALALAVDPCAAAENLRNLQRAGFTTPCGLAEAIDFSPERLGSRSCGVVNSAMAHHQGMLLLSCANALCDNAVRNLYARQSGARALLPLLEETPVSRRSLPHRERPRPGELTAPVRPIALSREAKPHCMPPDSHLLCGGGSALYLRADGEACLHSDGVRVNLFHADWTRRGSGFFTHLRETTSKESCSLLDAPARFAPGSAEFHRRGKALDVRLTFVLSIEDGALLRRVQIANRTSAPVQVELRDISLLSLCTDAQAAEHPAFHNLFLECSFPARRTLRITRRPRTAEDGLLTLDYTVVGLCEDDSCDLFADRACMLARGADPASAQNVFASPCRRSVPGAGLSPIQGARILLSIPAHGQREIGFSSLLSRVSDGESGPECDRYGQTDAFLRAQRLAESQTRAMLRFLDTPECTGAIYGRAASLCAYSRSFARKTAPLQPDFRPKALWPLGISGEKPLLCARVCRNLRGATDILRLHGWLCAMGVPTDALLLYEEEPGYNQPMRDQLLERIQESRLHSGDVRLLALSQIDASALQALERLSAVFLRENEALEDLLGDSFRWAQPPMALTIPLPAPVQRAENYGAFIDNGAAYRIHLLPGEHTPAAWCNVLAGETIGAIVSERGGGFLWYRNSRNARLTPFANDPFSEGAPLRVWIEENAQQETLLPRPHDAELETLVRQGESEMCLCPDGLRVRILRYTDPEQAVHAARICIEATDDRRRYIRLHAQCDWLMGVHEADLCALSLRTAGDCQLAAGAMQSVGCLRLPGAQAQDTHLALEFSLERGRPLQTTLLLCAADSADRAELLSLQYDAEAGLQRVRARWADLLSRVQIDTGNPLADALLSRWMPYQAISARFQGRAGLYQSGGAYGFRDQLQDAMCLCAIEPAWTRAHILLCAQQQFPEGDVQHWWHPPRTGVRTKISDDLLFLPWAAARYVQETGDASILSEEVPYLLGDPIPSDKHDFYSEPGLSDWTEPLSAHCMRALRRCASLTGAHGLPLMGSGDWNDGMDLIGAQGRGESVWLAEFLCVVAQDYAAIAPEHAEELRHLAERMRAAIEEHAWDGDRYLRAFRDDGSTLGSEETSGGCKIDALSQSWAVLAGCRRERTQTAMDTLWNRLFDSDRQILRLLDPPFDGNIAQTGYIAAYPPGIRENGGQYTHAACWAMLAYACLGDRTRAWTLLRALLPANHADLRERADRYRVEPYALAADIYACGASYQGRGGWTWYTGAAGWLFRAFLTGIAGLEKQGGRVRLHALLDEDMDELSVTLRYGTSVWRLVSARQCESTQWISLTDDGKEHTVRFSAR